MYFGKTEITQESPTFIIAELSCNHLGSYKVAEATIKAMHEAGADCVKLQTDSLDDKGSTIDCDNDYFKIDDDTLWDGRNIFDLYKETYTPWEWHEPLRELAEGLGMEFFSTPYSPESADFLESLDVPAYKIASFELVDLPLVEHIARKGKPMIMSTGMAELEDIEEAINVCKNVNNSQIALLKCTSSYPATLEEANVQTVPDMIQRFNVLSGVSDHTMGSAVPAAATALGGRIVEKHFILDRRLGGPDAAFSMEPLEFRNMVDTIRGIEKALGSIQYDLPQKQKNKKIFGRSLFIVKPMHAGEIFTEENVRSIRPGYGLSPNFLKQVIGKKVKRDVKKGTPLTFDIIE